LNFALSTVNPVARGIIHRLDRGTSGCVCLAKSNEAHMKLIASFFLRRVTKKYLALVQLSSSSSLEQEGVMNALVDGKPAVSKYKVVNKYYAGDGPNQGVALLEVETLTGRKHQVRVHCSGIGHPIIFDPLYSSFEPPVPASRRKTKKDVQRKRGKGDNTEEHVLSLPKAITDLAMSMTPGQERFFLHAQTLSIPEFDVDVQAPLPTWWTETLDQLES
jgi:23S rRNA-/tRNA-specific pseudouridylate synthase